MASGGHPVPVGLADKLMHLLFQRGNAGKQGLDMDRLVVSAYARVGPRAPRGRALIGPGFRAQRR